MDLAFNDLALQVARSLCFPLPYCRETELLLDLKLGRVLNSPSLWTEGFWLGQECSWGGLLPERVRGQHALISSEGGTTRPY